MSVTSNPYEVGNVVSPIKVSLWLKDKQHRGYNDWVVTIDGKVRQVLNEYVVFYAMTLEDALFRFDKDEVAKATIEYTDSAYVQRKQKEYFL